MRHSFYIYTDADVERIVKILKREYVGINKICMKEEKRRCVASIQKMPCHQCNKLKVTVEDAP